MSIGCRVDNVVTGVYCKHQVVKCRSASCYILQSLHKIPVSCSFALTGIAHEVHESSRIHIMNLVSLYSLSFPFHLSQLGDHQKLSGTKVRVALLNKFCFVWPRMRSLAEHTEACRHHPIAPIGKGQRVPLLNFHQDMKKSEHVLSIN